MTFSDQAMADLRGEAKRIGVTVSDLVRRIVDQWRDERDVASPVSSDVREALGKTFIAIKWDPYRS